VIWLFKFLHFTPKTGMAVGRDLKGEKNNVVAIIGDGAMTAGQAFEAMNNAGCLNSNMIVILNDNKQVSLPTADLDGPIPPVGALSRTLTRLQSSNKPRELREIAKVSITIHKSISLNVCWILWRSLSKSHLSYRNFAKATFCNRISSI